MSEKIEFIEYETVTVRKSMIVEISYEDFQLLEQGKIFIEYISQKYNDTTDCCYRKDLGSEFDSYGSWELVY